MSGCLATGFVYVLCGAILVGSVGAQTTFADYANWTYSLYAVNCSVDLGNSTNQTNPNAACGNSTSSELLIVLPASGVQPSNSIAVALAIVNNSLEEQGWDYAYFQPLISDPESAYFYGGYAEGYLTHERLTYIYNQNVPTVTGDGLLWVNEHLAYLNSSIYLHANDTYWAQVGNLFMLMHGIAQGYSARANELQLPGLHFRDIFLLNFAIEYFDVENIPPLSRKKLSIENQHCSALIKVTPEDLFVSHDTWDIYNGTIRQYKTYAMPSGTVSFSAMAGMISSGDDFYLTSNNLVVQETTNDFFGDALYEKIVPKSISEFLRVMTANFLATDGETWTTMFAFENSGTYNNQYMVVDFNLYAPGQALADGLLWVAEQIPGYVHAADVTQVLRDTGYWASYNTPYFVDVFNMSGFAAMEREFGPFFSYNDTSRAEIFRRQQSAVVDLASMKFMMRFNEFATDNESVIPRCLECNPRSSPLLAIASRGDLVDIDAVFPINATYARYFHRHFFGAVDTKITSYTLFSNNMQAVVINGPTTANGTLPVFEWPGQSAPAGCPKKYDFPWVTYNVPFVPPPPHGYFEGLFSTSTVVAIAVSVGAGLIIAVGLFVKFVAKPPTPYDGRLLS